jgi:hypothetical protein
MDEQERTEIIAFLKEGVAENGRYQSAWMSTHDTSLTNFM